jgi:hypothetical protein
MRYKSYVPNSYLSKVDKDLSRKQDSTRCCDKIGVSATNPPLAESHAEIPMKLTVR